jgi:TIR domain
MKVFISHSSVDKWVARRISQDLQAMGIETFLDEKDIETGDSFDDSIQEQLRESDELLMLLSPAALQSTWVVMEIGGAKVLGKRLIPILLHVGVNEMPSPLTKHASD